MNKCNKVGKKTKKTWLFLKQKLVKRCC